MIRLRPQLSLTWLLKPFLIALCGGSILYFFFSYYRLTHKFLFFILDGYDLYAWKEEEALIRFFVAFLCLLFGQSWALFFFTEKHWSHRRFSRYAERSFLINAATGLSSAAFSWIARLGSLFIFFISILGLESNPYYKEYTLLLFSLLIPVLHMDQFKGLVRLYGKKGQKLMGLSFLLWGLLAWALSVCQPGHERKIYNTYENTFAYRLQKRLPYSRHTTREVKISLTERLDIDLDRKYPDKDTFLWVLNNEEINREVLDSLLISTMAYYPVYDQSNRRLLLSADSTLSYADFFFVRWKAGWGGIKYVGINALNPEWAGYPERWQSENALYQHCYPLFLSDNLPPPPMPRDPHLLFADAVFIDITARNTILVDSVEILPAQIGTYLQDQMRQKGTRKAVLRNIHPQSMLSTYVRVWNAWLDCKESVREETAIRNFGKHWEKLTVLQQDELDESLYFYLLECPDFRNRYKKDCFGPYPDVLTPYAIPSSPLGPEGIVPSD